MGLPDANGRDWRESNGVIVIQFEENLKDFDDEVALEFVGENFKKEDSKLPYMTLSKQMDDKSWKAINRTFVSESKCDRFTT